MASPPSADPSPNRLLGIYLRDHYAGATAGLALVQRCRSNNAGTPYADMLGMIESQIAEDRQALLAIMTSLGVHPSSLKATLGSATELVARLKTNGRIFEYSPLSRVVELEGLAAGIHTKRNLWRTLRTVAVAHPVLEVDRLDVLIERASAQLDRVLEAHVLAVADAFVGPRRATPLPSTPV